MTKTKELSLNDLKNETREELVYLGEELKSQLNKHFKQHEAGLPYSTLISKYAKKARTLGLGLSQMSDILETERYIRVVATVNGKRMVFSGDCKWTEEEMLEWLQDMEMARITEKEFKKANKYV